MARRRYEYVRDPQAIYRASIAAIRREVAVDRLPDDLQPMALRLIHACAMPDIIDHLVCADGAVAAGRRALAAGAPILVDARMVAAGINPRALPADNPVVCMLDHPGTAARAAQTGTTRSAAGVDLHRERAKDALVVIGNAPTALFRLLELLEEGSPAPALVLAFPVGFIGAAEAKDALIADAGQLPYVTVRGRRGGSALAAAALNALTLEEP